MIRVNEDGSYSGPAAQDMKAGVLIAATEPPPPVGFRPWTPYILGAEDGPVGVLRFDVKKGEECQVIRKAGIMSPRRASKNMKPEPIFLDVTSSTEPDAQPLITFEVKQVEELLAMGGKFYSMGGEAWCDTAIDCWKLMPEHGGYVRQI